MVVVGVDYGRKRTGLAAYLEGVVLPLEPVQGGWENILDRIAELSERYCEISVVIGLPLSALGKTTELSGEVEQLAQKIREAGYLVELVNEARSSEEAQRLRGSKDRKGHIDSVAACEILKRHLNIL